jgi:HEPN domain-containing protein
MIKEIEFLKERAKEFYENAKHLFKEKKYNLSAFNLEQSCQLILKYLIAKKTGDWPKTHYLDELIEELAKVYKKKTILRYLQNNELFFENLTDAYFTSRYFPRQFSQNLVEKLFSEFENFIKFLEKVLKVKIF